MNVKNITKVFLGLIFTANSFAMMNCNQKAVIMPLWQGLHNTKLHYSDFHLGNTVVMYHKFEVCTAHILWEHCPRNSLHFVVPIANAINATHIAAFRGYSSSSPEPDGTCWGTVYYNFG